MGGAIDIGKVRIPMEISTFTYNSLLNVINLSPPPSYRLNNKMHIWEGHCSKIKKKKKNAILT